jgi:hypothetical protein
MTSNKYVEEVFQDIYFNDWRSRFLGMKELHQILELSDRKGLPNWLQGSGKNEWERGNQWVLKIVEAYDAVQKTLIVLWDGKGQGADLGGTAHMFELARNTGSIDIEIIDAKLLTSTDNNLNAGE